MWPGTQIDTVAVCSRAVQINHLPSGSGFSQFSVTRFGLGSDARNLYLGWTGLIGSNYQILHILRPQQFQRQCNQETSCREPSNIQRER